MIGAVISTLAFPAIIIFLILWLIFAPGIRAKAMLKKDPECLEHAAEHLDSVNIPFAWYAVLRPSSAVFTDRFTPFYLGMFDLHRQGMLLFTEDGIQLSKNTPAQNDIETQNCIVFRNLLVNGFPSRIKPSSSSLLPPNTFMKVQN